LNKKIQKGNLYIVLYALIISILFSACEKKDDSVIDPSYKSPLLSNPYKSKDTVFTVSGAPVINFNTSVSVDPNDGGDIKSVKCKVYTPDNLILASFEMTDSGVLPDSVQGDGRYSCTVNVTGISCLLVGPYSVRYIAENNAGLLSNQINSTMEVVMTNNKPPVLSALFAPDSIAIPSADLVIKTLSIFVLDSNGYCDIKNVFFNSYRPDSSLTNGSPFKMYDDGDITAHGDSIANDGRFSLIIQIQSTQTTTGWFTFKYQAEDNSGLLSSQYIGRIYIYRP
jgi:hypothetical protein